MELRLTHILPAAVFTSNPCHSGSLKIPKEPGGPNPHAERWYPTIILWDNNTVLLTCCLQLHLQPCRKQEATPCRTYPGLEDGTMILIDLYITTHLLTVAAPTGNQNVAANNSLISSWSPFVSFDSLCNNPADVHQSGVKSFRSLENHLFYNSIWSSNGRQKQKKAIWNFLGKNEDNLESVMT